MEEIKKCMRQVKTIISANCGVIDTAGKILAATNEIGEEETDPSFRAVVSSDNLFASTADRTYLKVFIGEQLKYILSLTKVFIHSAMSWSVTFESGSVLSM